mmetsp:Transcript_32110/g.61522  ORF Transcript_32110/g.61522 Transcript_32110/m.61522 type:complete len:102 (+) Transcript_32110:24-329(+)
MASNMIISSGRQVRNFWHATRRSNRRPSPLVLFRVPRGAGATTAAQHLPNQYFNRASFSTTAPDDDTAERTTDKATSEDLAAKTDTQQQQQQQQQQYQQQQ